MMGIEIEIDQDKERLDINMISKFLSTAYWSKGRTKSMIRKSIEYSTCFGVYHQSRQIGFARVVSDKVVYAYLMDVFILPEYRKRGFGIELIGHILNNPQLKDVQNWMLGTSNAHRLYEKFGFQVHPDPEKIMTRVEL